MFEPLTSPAPAGRRTPRPSLLPAAGLYQRTGWDPETRVPLQETLPELDLPGAVAPSR